MNDFLNEASFNSRNDNYRPTLKNTKTLEGRRFWSQIEKAANRTPQWIRPRIEKFAEELAKKTRISDHE